MITFGTAMKPVMRKGVRGDRIDAALPPPFRSRLPASATASDATFTLLLFPHNIEDVVRSAPVRRALARVAPEARIVAVAGNFTEEALQALDERGTLVLRVNDYLWTDESYARVVSVPLGLSPHRPTPKP